MCKMFPKMFSLSMTFSVYFPFSRLLFWAEILVFFSHPSVVSSGSPLQWSNFYLTKLTSNLRSEGQITHTALSTYIIVLFWDRTTFFILCHSVCFWTLNLTKPCIREKKVRKQTNEQTNKQANKQNAWMSMTVLCYLASYNFSPDIQKKYRDSLEGIYQRKYLHANH